VLLIPSVKCETCKQFPNSTPKQLSEKILVHNLKTYYSNQSSDNKQQTSHDRKIHRYVCMSILKVFTAL
jgi:hypothetical protein